MLLPIVQNQLKIFKQKIKSAHLTSKLQLLKQIPITENKIYEQEDIENYP